MLSDNPVAIVGISVPRVAKSIPDETSTGLIIKAIRGALADAGMSKEEVNGACIDWPGPGGSPQGGSTNWGRLLGINLNWVVDFGLDRCGVRGVLNAAAAIQAGLCETVVIAQGNAGGPPMSGSQRRSLGAVANLEFNSPYGGWTMVRFAALARRHMHDYGTTQEQLAEVAATIRNHGSMNPEAMMYGRGPYSVDDVLNSRWVAEPLHLLDCCLVGQGACAMVVTSGERARALRADPVYVLSGAMEMPQGPHANPCLNREYGMLGSERMKVAYGQAGLKPMDIDVLSLYDPTSFEVIRQMEVLGFCKEGEGGSFIEGGRIGLKGEIPTNTDGGILSHAWIQTGQLALKVIEGVRQLRGSSGDRQVPGAETAVCTNAAPGAFHWEAVILGR